MMQLVNRRHRGVVMDVNYEPNRHIYSTSGPRIALENLLGEKLPQSLLDVGCGPGDGMRAAMDVGVSDVVGVDGVAFPRLRVPKETIQIVDLTLPFNFGRRFDLVLCLEVAE